MPKPTFQQVFGAYLRHLRKAMGLNQIQFATKLNISQSHLSALELGDRMPSGPAMDGIVDSLGLDVASLLRGMEAVARPSRDKSTRPHSSAHESGRTPSKSER